MIGGAYKFCVGTRNCDRLMSIIHITVNEKHRVNMWHLIVRWM